MTDLANQPVAPLTDSGLDDLSVETPRVVTVEEQTPTNIPASLILRDGRLDVYPSIAQHGYFTVRPRTDSLALQAGGHIGIIPLNPRLTIDVRPRVLIDNLSRVLRVSGTLPTDIYEVIRHYESEPELYPSLVDIYSRAMIAYVNDIILRGSLREYKRQEGATSFPRGRILMGATAKSLASRGITHKVMTSWFYRTTDNDVNRCIKYALWLLLRTRIASPGLEGSRATLRGLGNAYRQFDGVTLEHGKHFLRHPIVRGSEQVPMLRGYYRPPLALALAIIRQHAVTLDGARGGLSLPSIVLNMATAFEDYLRNALRSISEGNSWPVRVLNGNHKLSGGGGGKPLLDGGPCNVGATPDIVLERVDDPQTFPLVIEVKYKPGQVRRDDLNQVISYGASYRAPRVVVVQPLGKSGTPTSGLHPLGSIGGMTVFQYVIDLNASDLNDEETAFGDEMLRLCSTGSAST